ncbi:MAG: LLM class F420-dependent oxidoreductase [Anaerolineaceae bacterium]|nr:LLM class F420-dependent oxidoreductase [Anaerolineaceae bacterium]
MKFGAIYPHFEFGSEPAAIRDYAQTAEELGFTHIGADDHVISPNPQRTDGWQGWTHYQMPFQEPFTLFAFWAGMTTRIGFSTCVLLLPQRQTVMAAKQAAMVDSLSGGRLRLGIGIGWNTIEYTALNENFRNRGARLEEQIEVLRLLWTQELVTFEGKWHHIPDAGINPLPVQRPIPIWFGGQSEAALQRMARLGDGWMPLFGTAEEAAPALERLRGYLAEAGRTAEGFGLEARIPYGTGDPRVWQALLEGWRELGFTHASLITTGCGLKGPMQHLDALCKFAAAVKSLI